MEFYAADDGKGWGVWRWDGADEMLLITRTADAKTASGLALLLGAQ